MDPFNLFLLLGSNTGNRVANLANSLSGLNAHFGTPVQTSSVYETEAWGKTDQPDFLNQVIQYECFLQPTEVLGLLQSIEKKLGRIRREKWGPRIIDIDLLYAGEQIICLPDLIVPHPGIATRRFVLEPLSEISPDFMHPVLQKTNRELLVLCQDTLLVKKILQA